MRSGGGEVAPAEEARLAKGAVVAGGPALGTPVDAEEHHTPPPELRRESLVVPPSDKMVRMAQGFQHPADDAGGRSQYFVAAQKLGLLIRTEVGGQAAEVVALGQNTPEGDAQFLSHWSFSRMNAALAKARKWTTCLKYLGGSLQVK